MSSRVLTSRSARSQILPAHGDRLPTDEEGLVFLYCIHILELVKKSRVVTLTAVAAMGIASRGQAQDPCDAATFDPKVCRTAVHRSGYCSQGLWIPMSYPQTYPYYYNLYQDFVATGGVAVPASETKCRRPSVTHGGFGVIGFHRLAGS
jgi:hypothetical protein